MVTTGWKRPPTASRRHSLPPPRSRSKDGVGVTLSCRTAHSPSCPACPTRIVRSCHRPIPSRTALAHQDPPPPFPWPMVLRCRVRPHLHHQPRPLGDFELARVRWLEPALPFVLAMIVSPRSTCPSCPKHEWSPWDPILEPTCSHVPSHGSSPRDPILHP